MSAMNVTLFSINFVKTPTNLFAKSGPGKAPCSLTFHSVQHCSQIPLSVSWVYVGDKHHDVVNTMFFHQGDWS